MNRWNIIGDQCAWCMFLDGEIIKEIVKLFSIINDLKFMFSFDSLMLGPSTEFRASRPRSWPTTSPWGAARSIISTSIPFSSSPRWTMSASCATLSSSAGRHWAPGRWFVTGWSSTVGTRLGTSRSPGGPPPLLRATLSTKSRSPSLRGCPLWIDRVLW